jgi:hypothetical protein
MFVLKPAAPTARLALILATGTWCAYNDWGGSNHYQGLTGPSGGDFAAEVSSCAPGPRLRPLARGRAPHPACARRSSAAQRYPHMDYARANGISKKYASSGWAAFERPFALWCEAQGIALDYAHPARPPPDPDLDAYPRAVIVGHDEYWTWEMRDHLEGWTDRGGQLARFAGNFFWQTRLSDDRPHPDLPQVPRRCRGPPRPDRPHHQLLGPPPRWPPRQLLRWA